MSMKSSTALSHDPRQPSAAKPFTAPMVSPQDLPVDYSGFFAVICAVVGVMFRYKLGSWLAIIFCTQSLANMKNMESDFRQISMAMMFAVIGLVHNYRVPVKSLLNYNLAGAFFFACCLFLVTPTVVCMGKRYLINANACKLKKKGFDVCLTVTFKLIFSKFLYIWTVKFQLKS